MNERLDDHTGGHQSRNHQNEARINFSLNDSDAREVCRRIDRTKGV